MFLRALILTVTVMLAAAGAAQAQATRGDVNCDGTVDGLDVWPFVLAVTDPSAYEALYPGCESSQADFDCNGSVDATDMDGFVDCMVSGNCFGCSPLGMVMVRAGSFLMGDWKSEGQPDETPAHTVYVSSFYVDTCEVTNQQYADGLNWALAEGGMITVVNGVVCKFGGTTVQYCDTAASSSWSGITWNGTAFGVAAGRGNHPMMVVSWYGAVAYANWRSGMQGRPLCYDLSTWACNFSVNGYRLPTEAEWEKAAAWDPVLRWPFRFGEHTDGCGLYCLDGHRANYASSGDPFDSASIPTTPVGYYDGTDHGAYVTQDAKSFYGCRDMSGNVYEWCNDWYSSTYYATSPSSDPTGPASGTNHVNRGGSWINDPYATRTTRRNQHAPADRYPNDGFRVVLGVR